MKRLTLLLLGVALAWPAAANAQLTMQMPNGWAFTFSGNVNAFLVYEKENADGTTSTDGGIVGASDTSGSSRIRTGLLPAFAVFDAKGKEGNTDLGVHFGFAPQIQCGGAAHDCLAQIDMRQVYMTIGGSWGQILAGRELAVFGRQNLLTDQTLYGIGATGGQSGGGTTLGRIGFGYIYPNFVSQITYSSKSDRPVVVTIGLFDPAVNGPYDQIQVPRLEGEAVWTKSAWKAWVGGALQNNKNGANDEGASAVGLSGGVRYGAKAFAVTGSGYYGRGVGTTFLFADGTDGTGSGTDDLRKSLGYIGQVTFSPQNSKVTIAGSYGVSQLENADAEETTNNFKTENGLISGGLYYQATKSLKFTVELNYAWTKDKEAPSVVEDNSSFAPAVGFLLLF